MTRKKAVRKAKPARTGQGTPEGQTGSPAEAVAHSEGVEAPRSEGGRQQKVPAFPIVGIGALAGGRAALEAFFANMPADSGTGIALVVVHHLDPDHKSILSGLLKKRTQLKVLEVTDGMMVQPNRVYVIPPNKDMALLHGRLTLLSPAAPRGLRLPIDYFFRSLAQDQQERAICIVLSGTGTDGMLGLKAIKEAGGMAMVQQPESAKFDGMPRSALPTALVDFVLPPEVMPEQLIAYVRRTFGPQPLEVVEPAPPEEAENAIQKIFVLLRAETGHDLSHYKRNTVQRRIERRMVVNQIQSLDLYVSYLQQNPVEVATLFRELLIGVTNFFRDPAAFEALREQVIVGLLQRTAPGDTVRVWVPACSTGEEAYSIAILLREQAHRMGQERSIQVFATDIDREAIEQARAGLYPGNIAADVSPERLARFFDQENGSYRVKKTIRNLVVFAEQSVTEDPPFSKMDLISCRNLLIYMAAELQKTVLPILHYSLNQDGYLFLGSAESVGESGDLFAPVDRKWKIFERKGTVARKAIVEFPMPVRGPAGLRQRAAPGEGPEGKPGPRELLEHVLLGRHSPACALVTESGEMLYTHGRTSRYLEPPTGEPSLNILMMARQELRLELTNALRKAVTQKESVAYKGLQGKADGEAYGLNLLVEPLTELAAARGLILVVFEEVPPARPLKASAASAETGTDQGQRIAALERDLRGKEQHLQTTIEELQTSNEELKSSNQELQSSNEKLQSSNEELGTSKEELQSVNEELVTVNTELQKKIEELSRASSDFNNLLAGTGVSTVFVDHELRIQRFTPAVTRIINLIQHDVGRPVGHLASNLVGYDRLAEDTRMVLADLAPREAEVQTRDGQWHLMRIMPYRTIENVIEGAVLTFIDITRQKEVQEQLRAVRQAQEIRDLATNVVDTVRGPLLVLDAELRVVSANRAFCEIFRVKREQTVGRLLYDLGQRQWDIPELQRLLEKVLPRRRSFKDFRVTVKGTEGGQRVMLLNARELSREAGKERLILLAMEEITDKAGRAGPNQPARRPAKGASRRAR